MVNIVEVPQNVKDEQTEFAGRSRERGPDQIAMDERVKVLAAEHEAAGKPDQAHAPYRRYKVSKAERSETKRLIRRAANLAGYDPLYWKDSKPTKAGDVFIKYALGPRKVTTSQTSGDDDDDAQDAPETADAPEQNENADQGGDQPQATPESARRGILSGRR